MTGGTCPHCGRFIHAPVRGLRPPVAAATLAVALALPGCGGDSGRDIACALGTFLGHAADRAACQEGQTYMLHYSFPTVSDPPADAPDMPGPKGKIGPPPAGMPWTAP